MFSYQTANTGCGPLLLFRYIVNIRTLVLTICLFSYLGYFVSSPPSQEMALATTTSSLLSSKSLMHHRRSLLPSSGRSVTALKPISAVHSTDPANTKTVSTKWTPDSWRNKKALQIPEYPNKAELDSVLDTLSSFPPIVFAGESRKLEDRLGQAALGNAFLLMGGDCAESFKEFNANNIRDTFRVLLQMSVVLMFGGQMPVIKVINLLIKFLIK